ncbi:selenide, water dikinase SelD [Bacteroidota bacterium]
MEEEIKLTQFSHGGGCGCKISPRILAQILASDKVQNAFPNLLVGNATKDDAAVYQINNDQAIISTTDFFMPIVDDAFQFGGIASANAISDIYAMGGKPLMAIAILGWPITKIPAEVASKVMEGARAMCEKANIPLAGGHSIDSPEPIFGLAVTGIINAAQLKTNDQAKPGDLIFLTKRIGVGIISTAQKRGKADAEDHKKAVDQMLTLNDFGATVAPLNGITCMTDVTGFGLIGHLVEVCEGSGVSAQINFDSVPMLDGLKGYLDQSIHPGMTKNNFDTHADKVSPLNDLQRLTLFDPQTSGGLLICVRPEAEAAFLELAKKERQFVRKIGMITPKEEKVISVV